MRRTVGFMVAAFDQIGALPAVLVALLIAVLMFVDASPGIGLLLPGDLLVVTIVAASQPVESALALAGVVVGTLASWSIFFFVGRRVGPRLRDGRFGRWIGGRRWDAAEQLVLGRGARALTLTQFLPVLNAVVPMAAGGLGMRYSQFLRFAVPGTVLWAAFFGALGVWSGLASGAVLGDSGSPLAVLVFAAPGFVAGSLILFLIRGGMPTRPRPAPYQA